MYQDSMICREMSCGSRLNCTKQWTAVRIASGDLVMVLSITMINDKHGSCPAVTASSSRNMCRKPSEEPAEATIQLSRLAEKEAQLWGKPWETRNLKDDSGNLTDEIYISVMTDLLLGRYLCFSSVRNTCRVMGFEVADMGERRLFIRLGCNLIHQNHPWLRS